MKHNFNGEGATARLIDFIHKTQFSDLPPEVIHASKRMICDTIGCAVGGHLVDGGQIMTNVVRELGGPPQATIIGSNSPKVSMAAAAYLNSYLSNVLDADDTLMNSTHIGAMTVPVALAVAETEGLSGKDVITAVALGYEIAGRMSNSLLFSFQKEDGTMERGNFQSNRGAYGTSSAAMTAGKLFGLNQDQLNNAFGLASWASPLGVGHRWESISTNKPMLKYWSYHLFGFNGIMSVQLAKNGFTGDRNILDGENGYWKMLGAREQNWNLLLGELGERWWICEAAFKPYAFGHYIHYPVEVFKKIVKEHNLSPEEIETIHVKIFGPAVKAVGKIRHAENHIDSQFSLPLALGAALYGSALGAEWQEESKKDRRYREFANKVTLEDYFDGTETMMEDLRSDGFFSRVPTVVTVMARGEIYSDSIEYTRGDPWNKETRMSDEEIKEKFHRFTKNVLGNEKSKAAADIVFNLENVKDIGKELMLFLKQ